MIKIKCKIIDQPISILIDLGESHSYIASNLVERFNLEKEKKAWKTMAGIVGYHNQKKNQ